MENENKNRRETRSPERETKRSSRIAQNKVKVITIDF